MKKVQTSKPSGKAGQVRTLNTKPTKEETKAAFEAQAPSVALTLRSFSIGGRVIKPLSLNRYVGGDMVWARMADVAGIPFFVTSAWANEENGKVYFRCFFTDAVIATDKDGNELNHAPGTPVHISMPWDETRDNYAEQIGKHTDDENPVGPLVYEPIVNKKNGNTFYSIEQVNIDGGGVVDAVVDEDIPM